MALGRNIRRIREALGIKGPTELARMCGVKAMTIYQLEERDSEWSKFDTKIASALGVPLHLLREGTDADIDAWLAQRKEGGEAPWEAPGPVAAPSIQAALPVVLEAMRACPHREELRTLMTLLIDIDAEPYRKRLLELLDTQSVPRPPAQTKRREDAVQEESPHATAVVGRTTGAR